MELPGATPIDHDRCSNLLWKGIFIEAGWDPNMPHSGDRLFWCHQTQNCLGPDGRAVDDYECNETRRCYRPL
ncbi:MAG: hypothetical protein IT168_16420 [Bryobacterales bacterium]|nr:hypothetical protein [Bryobacterales bacterium]